MNGTEYGPDVCTGGIATASYYEPYPTHPNYPLVPSNAFDDNIGTPWGTWPKGPPQWIKYELPSAKVVVRYTITSRGIDSEDPKSWIFQGSNNNINWAILHTVTNQPGWSGQEKRIFTFSNTTAYKYYRIDVSANYGGGAVCMAEIEMMERLQIFTCPYCGATFSTQTDLDAHITSVHPSVVYTCSYCGATFSSQTDLDAHITSLHPTAIEIPWYKRYAPYLITIIGGAIGVTVVYFSLRKRG